MGSLILPPSCNWFEHNSVSSRAPDRLLVSSCFKNIVVYKIPEEKGLPRALKLIPHMNGKVRGVSIFPDPSNHDFGHTLAAFGDQSTLSLIDIRKGTLLALHKVEKFGLNAICWGSVGNEDVVIAVGDQGLLLVWQPKYLVAKTFFLEPKKKLTVVEVIPQLENPPQCLVASDKTILRVSLLNGNILGQYKGHDMPIYCIRLYAGDKNPREVNSLPTNTRWKRDEDCTSSLNHLSLNEKNGGEEEEEQAPPGPFFASSDYGRKILVWDLSIQRFLAGFTANGSARKMGKDRSQGRNSHISLNWAQDQLYSTTVNGEVLEWNLSLPEPRCRVVTHSHSRVIYNLEVMDNILMTFSQDRLMHGFDLVKGATFYSMPTMGACAHSMAFSPHDGNRLAVGMQDETIKLLTFGDKAPIKTHTIYQNIKGKVLTIAWHPVQESKLLFGTSEGQVGIADVISNRTTTFAYFHQKSTYKVEFGPAVSPDTTGMNEEWYAYSFGDRELLARNTSNTMEDPIKVDKLLGVEKKTNGSFTLSEFSFSPNRQLLAIGSLSGEIKIFDRITLQCKVVIPRVRKVIQHLLWKPSISSSLDPYILGVASGENSVYIFNLEKQVKESTDPEVPVVVTQASQELCAHVGRVIWLSWSLHHAGLLATSSYDHTVQIWDTNTGDPVCNYGGHTHRVFRAEFSPLNPDRVVSFAEENCIHEWRPSEQTSRTPAESAASLKLYKKVPKMEHAEDAVEKDEGGQIIEGASSSGSSKPTCELSASQIKKLGKRSSFPLFHNVSSRKKNFHHMCLLSLVEMKQAQEVEKVVEASAEELEDTIEENPVVNGDAKKDDDLDDHIKNAMIKYSDYFPSEQTPPETEDIAFFLKFFGSLPQVDQLVNDEIKNHEEAENFSRANLMHCWRGSLESQIKWAAKQKKLDPFLVAAAPQVSFTLWEEACAAYAEQLAEQDDPVTAATYLISVHKDEEAINLLMKHRYYREALTIAKYKLGFNPEIIQKVLNTWANSTMFEGNFEIASVLKFCLGNIEDAARILSKRTEPRSLIVATQLFLLAQSTALATSTAILAFKEASNKKEFYKFEPILKQMPHLEWCRCINLCNESIWDHIGLFKKKFSSRMSSPHEEDLEKEKEVIVGPTLAMTVRQRWSQAGIAFSEYSKLSKDIENGLSSQMSPTSLKNLWFLVSISLSQFLLDGSAGELSSRSEQYLESVLKYVTFWGKDDQTFYLTHILLPNGVTDLSPLGIKPSTEKTPGVVGRLRCHYILSETKMILSLMENEDYLPWKEEVEQSTVKLNGTVNGTAITNDVETCSSVVEGDNLSGGDQSNQESKVEINCDKNNIYLFNCENDFFSLFENYVDICIDKNLNDSNAEESIKNIAEIIAKLHAKSKATLQFLNNIVSKIESRI